MIGCTLQTSAEIVAACFGIAGPLVFAEFGVGVGACVGDTGSVDTTLTVFAGHTRARIGFALAVGTALPSGTGWAIFDTRSVCGTATLTSSALFRSTGIIDTLAGQTKFPLGTTVAITSGVFADFLNANTVSTAICVVFARLVTDTLTVLAGASGGATQTTAGIVDTAIDIAESALFTRIVLTCVGRACSSFADLALWTLNGCTRIGVALSVGADLTFGAENTKTHTDAGTGLTDLIGGAVGVGARVFETGSVAA